MVKIGGFVEKLVPDAQAVFRRFPVAVLMVGLFASVVMMKTNSLLFDDETTIGLIGGTVLAAYLSIILSLVGEGREKPVSLIIHAAVCCVALIISYFFRQFAFVMPMAIGASILFLGSAPFWRADRNDVAVWDFTHKLWTAVIFTVVGSVIYTAGIFSISFALKSLFGLRMDDFVLEFLLPIGLAFLAPVCWMAMLPKHDEDDEDSLRNPGFISRAVGFLGTWILAPLTLIYALILIAYGLKIILAMSLPNGEIGQLVTPFLVIGTLTWLILDPPFIQEKRLARWYGKFWFPLAIPAAILLAIAIFVRIGQYGWTTERYLLVLAAVWAMGIALWFTFRAEAKRDIRIIPGFAALLLAIGSIGPWGADQFSAINQNTRLTQGLKANDMLDANGQLKPLADLEITDNEMAVRASGALRYLVKRRKAKRLVAYIPAGDEFELADATSTRGRLDMPKFIQRFNLEDVKYPDRYGNSYVYYNYHNDQQSVDIAGYTHLSQSNYVNLNSDARFVEGKTLGQYQVSSENGRLLVRVGADEISSFDAYNWLKQQPTSPDNQIDVEPRHVIYASDSIEIAIHITQANITKGGDENSGGSMQYLLMWKGIDMGEVKPIP